MPTNVRRIPLTKGLFALVDEVDFEEASRINWYASGSNRPNGRHYAAHTGPKPERASLYLHRWIAVRMGLDVSASRVDHRNGDGLDCRRANLRTATARENARNSHKRSNNTSGYKGVSRARGSWVAHIAHAGTHRYLGKFQNARDAAMAYDAAARELHGDFAATNSEEVNHANR